ncbi:MAG: NAD(P)-binding domain-containing protein, partial [Chloroflexi bacterium]|nr:NAD(P)-binding domain-containing protein [Chloroflexota bacterium]
MAKMYYDNDADLGLIKNTPIAIIGFGSQGHAHALNLRDNGCNVRVGLYNGSKSWAKAEAAGLRVTTVEQATAEAEIIMILTPDIGQAQIYRDSIAPQLSKGKLLMFAHGFAIRYGQIEPPADVDVAMVAPKAPGHRVREVFEHGGGTPGLVAVQQNASGKALEKALAYAKGIGCTR